MRAWLRVLLITRAWIWIWSVFIKETTRESQGHIYSVSQEHHKHGLLLYVHVRLQQTNAFWCWKVKNVSPLPLWLNWNRNAALLWASAAWIHFFCKSVITASVGNGPRKRKMAKAILLTLALLLAATSVSGAWHLLIVMVTLKYSNLSVQILKCWRHALRSN